MTEKIPISGGPHTGKTTLLKALEQRFPDAYYLPEPATIVIDKEFEEKARNNNYQMRVPWIDYSEFGPLVVEQSEVLERLIPSYKEISFQDRSLIDTIAYCRLEGFDDLIPEVQRKVQLANYSFALLCQPVGEYAVTELRRESADKSLQTHTLIEEAYYESGLDIINIPAVSVDERLDLISDILHERNLV